MGKKVQKSRVYKFLDDGTDCTKITMQSSRVIDQKLYICKWFFGMFLVNRVLKSINGGKTPNCKYFI